MRKERKNMFNALNNPDETTFIQLYHAKESSSTREATLLSFVLCDPGSEIELSRM